MQMIKFYSSGVISPSREGNVLAAYSMPLVLSCAAMAISLSLSLSKTLSMLSANSHWGNDTCLGYGPYVSLCPLLSL